MERYDPVADVWVDLASMTTAREGHAVTTLKGSRNASVFAMGGSDGKKILESCERYVMWFVVGIDAVALTRYVCHVDMTLAATDGLT